MDKVESNKDSDSDARDSSSAVSQSINGNGTASDSAEWQKCKLCKKRLGRRNCPHQACVKCCTDPACEPHAEAREILKKRESILDGTDSITRAAAEKRASRVTPGAFFDSDIRYFGETVVIWDVNEFMEVPKWREDAMRRSRNRKDNGQFLDLRDVVGGGKRRKRKEEGGEEGVGATVAKTEEGNGRKKRSLSRRKRFKNICDELYQNSLKENERNRG